MMLSPKNTLQEFCVKNKHSIPSYDTKKVGGTPHAPEWLSYVTIVMKKEGKDQSITVPGDVSMSKTEAEKTAATCMLTSLGVAEDPLPIDEVEKDMSLGTLPPSVPEEPGMAILIDVENIPNMIFSAVTLKQKYPKANITIFACVGQHHHSAKKDFGRRVKKVVVPTTRKDGVDTFIQMYAGHLMRGTEFDSFAIATGDHFGHALVELIEEGFTADESEVTQKRAIVVTTQEQLFRFFEEKTR